MAVSATITEFAHTCRTDAELSSDCSSSEFHPRDPGFVQRSNTFNMGEACFEHARGHQRLVTRFERSSSVSALATMLGDGGGGSSTLSSSRER